MKKFVLVLAAIFAMSAVSFGDEHGAATTDHATTAPTGHGTKTAKRKAKKERKAKKASAATDGAAAPAAEEVHH